MAYPKTYAPVGYPVSAFLELAVDIGSVAANTALVVEVVAPRSFRYGSPVLIQLKLGETALEAGISITLGQVVSSTGKKIRFRVVNSTVGAVDPASKVFQFLQL